MAAPVLGSAHAGLAPPPDRPAATLHVWPDHTSSGRTCRDCARPSTPASTAPGFERGRLSNQQVALQPTPGSAGASPWLDRRGERPPCSRRRPCRRGCADVAKLSVALSPSVARISSRPLAAKIIRQPRCDFDGGDFLARLSAKQLITVFNCSDAKDAATLRGINRNAT